MNEDINAGVLFSGGKDSVYSLYLAKKAGHKVSCLITIIPFSNESWMFHHPFIRSTDLISQCLNIPLIINESSSLNDELDVLKQGIKDAIHRFNINAIYTGAIASKYQKERIEKICDELDLRLFSPLWNKNQLDILKEELCLLDFVIVSITSFGMKKELLGKVFKHKELNEVIKTSVLTNKAFEGGEAETLVVDCPLYTKRIVLKNQKIKSINEYEHFLIADLELEDK